MIKIVDVYIEDSGYVKWDWGVSDTIFPDYDDATSEQKGFGEFKVEERVRLKIRALNFGASVNDQTVNKLEKIGSEITTTSYEPTNFSITGYLSKPTKSFANTSQSLKDLEKLPQIFLMQFTRGHKNLYIADSVDTNREQLFSLYHLMTFFGRTDATRYEGTKRHLNLKIDSVSFNEGEKEIAVNITAKLLWSL